MIAADTKKPRYRNPGIEAIERYAAAHPRELEWGAVPAFVGFNAVVDGATLSDGSMVEHLAKVGPGVTVASGMKILPGKRVTTQAEADDTSLGKSAYISEADVAFMLDVVKVNIRLAAGYAELANENPKLVKGINVDPGAVQGNETSELPTIGGRPVQQADTGKYRFRIIGDVRIADIGGIRDSVSLRADEGPTMVIGSRGHFHGCNTMHALEKTNIAAGHDVILRAARDRPWRSRQPSAGRRMDGNRGPHPNRQRRGRLPIPDRRGRDDRSRQPGHRFRHPGRHGHTGRRGMARRTARVRRRVRLCRIT